MNHEHDDLFERLRAADPARAARLDDRTDGAGSPRASARPSEGRLRLVAPGGRDAPPAGLRAVAAARRRHLRQRVNRMAAATTALACAATAAFAVGLPGGGPGGGGDTGLRAFVPSLAEVAARAGEASRPRAEAILYYRSEVEYGTLGGLQREQRTTMLRYDAEGRIVAMRAVQVHDGGGHPRIADSVSVRDPAMRHGGTIEMWDSTRRRVRRIGGVTVPFVVHRTAELLRTAEQRAKRRGGEVVRVDYDGRAAYRVDVSDVDWQREAGERRTLLVDAETYAPVLFAIAQRTSDGAQVPTASYEERILEIRTLDDTPENRRMLELRGPTR